MSLAGMLTRSQGILAANLGDHVVVYDRHSLQTTGTASARVTALVVAADAAIGSTQIVAELADNQRMRGRLPAGLAIEVDGTDLVLAEVALLNKPEATIALKVAATAIAFSEGDPILLQDAVQIAYKGRRRSSGQRYMPGVGAVGARVKMTLKGDIEPPIGGLLEGEVIFEVLETAPAGSKNWRVSAGAIGAA